MLTRKRIAALSVASLLTIAIAIYFAQTQPSYKGRNLDSWLDEVHERGVSEDFRAAIDSMGTNSLKQLMKYSVAIDTKLKVRTFTFFKNKLGLDLPFHFAESRRGPALAALMHLGPHAAPIIPDLMANFEKHPFTTVFPLVFIRQGVEPALINLCQSTNINARAAAAEGLARVQNGMGYIDQKLPGSYTTNLFFQLLLVTGDSTRQWIARNLSHTNPAVRRATADYFAIHPGLAKPVLPTLKTLARADRSPLVREAALNAVTAIETP